MAGDLWYPGGVLDEAPSTLWGTHVPGARPKFLLHTTEGGLGAYSPDPRRGVERRYFGHTYWPTYTLALGAPVPDGRWHVYQHIPANRSARALANAPGGVETNRANVSQVEIAWKAARIAELPEDALDELARLLAWEHEVRGVPLIYPECWAGPEGSGTGAAQRMPPVLWTAYGGICGHQHAPENQHWDPGAFPIEALLSRTREITGGVDVAIPEQVAEATVGLLQRQAWERPDGAAPDWHPPRQRHVGAMLRRAYEMAGETLGHAVAVRRLVEGIAAGNAEALLRNLPRAELDRLAGLLDELRREGG